MDERGLIRNPQEIVSPLQMEALVRGAVQEAGGPKGPRILIPYHKRLHGHAAAMSIKRSQGFGVESVSIDIGVLNPTGKLTSVGYVDFTEQFGAVHRRKRAAVIQDEHFEWVLRDPGIEREKSTPGIEGIRVDETARRLKLGTSLITAARVVSDELGMPDLLIKAIKTGDTPGGNFYKSLGGVVFEDNIPATEYTREMVKTNMVLPTASTPYHPYLFI